ncbi:unnamed protein product [Ophioblennius macclurei]
MGKRKDLSDFEKGQIVMARRLGQSISQTAALVGCSRCAVVNVYQKWSREGEPVNRRQGHGRPKLIDARGERKLARVVRSNRKATVAEIAEKLNAHCARKVSEHTVHRSLLRLGLRYHKPARVSILTLDSSRKRLQWAQQHRDWTPERWRRVVWSGESSFFLYHVDGKVRVRRLPGEHLAPGCAADRGCEEGAGSLMLWAMFCWDTLGPALHVDSGLDPQSYLDIVADHVHPFMGVMFPEGGGLFQQDNAPCYVADSVQRWFEEHDQEFTVLTWPPNSPDLNPIEHLWDLLDKQIQAMEDPPHTLQDFKDLLLTFWCQIPQETFRSVVQSMPERVSAVFASQGGLTQY